MVVSGSVVLRFSLTCFQTEIATPIRTNTLPTRFPKLPTRIQYDDQQMTFRTVYDLRAAKLCAIAISNPVAPPRIAKVPGDKKPHPKITYWTYAAVPKDIEMAEIRYPAFSRKGTLLSKRVAV